MSHTERYRGQHAEIMQPAAQLGRQLAPAALAADATPARKALSELSGKLIVHNAAEDKLLYPRLLQSTDTATRTVAQRFLAEMGPISQTFKDYAVRWGTAQAIQSDAQKFVSETQAILKSLVERIRHENAELYPLADKA